MDGFGIDGVISGISQRSGSGVFAGFALPVQARTGPLGSVPLEEFALSRMTSMVGSGQVLMIEMGGAEISTMGGIGAKAAALRGAEAVIIDGACRDIQDIRALGLWVASRFVTPRTGKRRAALASIGESATVGGVRVRVGDLVVGDETGIVVVPQSDILRVLAAAERIQMHDDRIEHDVASGVSLEQASGALKNSS